MRADIVRKSDSHHACNTVQKRKKKKKTVAKPMTEVVRPKQDVGGVRGSRPTEQ